jgi:hypothetical protein
MIAKSTKQKRLSAAGSTPRLSDAVIFAGPDLLFITNCYKTVAILPGWK